MNRLARFWQPHVMSTELGKFLRLSWASRLLLAEAFVWISFCSLAIAIVPFRFVARVASRPAGNPAQPCALAQAAVERVRWAIAVVAARVPWRAVCLQQGLAAQLMLRRRGVRSVLHYGASQRPGTGLTAHAWVRAGDLDVVGCETASQYALLASFPNEDGESAARISV